MPYYLRVWLEVYPTRIMRLAPTGYILTCKDWLRLKKICHSKTRQLTDPKKFIKFVPRSDVGRWYVFRKKFFLISFTSSYLNKGRRINECITFFEEEVCHFVYIHFVYGHFIYIPSSTFILSSHFVYIHFVYNHIKQKIFYLHSYCVLSFCLQ